MKSLQQIGKPIVAIPNGTALYIYNLGMKSIGNEPAYLFESESKNRLQMYELIPETSIHNLP